MSRYQSERKRVEFRCKAHPGSKVLLAGTFNNWETQSKKAKVMKDKTGQGSFCRTLVLPRGKYEYKFIVDGKWVADDDANWVPNSLGTLNSIVEV